MRLKAIGRVAVSKKQPNVTSSRYWFKKADAKYNSGLFDQALSEQVVCNASFKMPKPKKKNEFLPICMEDWNKYITFVA